MSWRDLGDVADHVGEGPAERIDPDLAHVGGDARQLRRAHVDAGELLPGQVLDHRDRGAARGARRCRRPGARGGRRPSAPAAAAGRAVPSTSVFSSREQQRRKSGRLEASTTPLRSRIRPRGGGVQAELELVVRPRASCTCRPRPAAVAQPAAERRQAQRRQPAHQERAAVEHRLPLVDLVEVDRRVRSSEPHVLVFATLAPAAAEWKERRHGCKLRAMSTADAMTFKGILIPIDGAPESTHAAQPALFSVRISSADRHIDRRPGLPEQPQVSDTASATRRVAAVRTSGGVVWPRVVQPGAIRFSI